MQKRFIIAFGIMFIFLAYGVSALGCPVKPTAKTTSALLAEIPSINDALKTCPMEIPSQMKKLITNGVFLLEITDNDDISATINQGNLTEVKIGDSSSYNYKISVSSCQLDNILSKQNPVGAFAAYYLSGKANLGAKGFVNKIKLWIGKMFLKPALNKVKVAVDDCTNSTNAKEPKNCYATYMAGYSEYSDPQVKEIWDQRFAETGHICQTQTAEKPKDGDCKYLYEQIKNNDKKWVCWY